MNYNILLAIHNMHVVDKMFENLREQGVKSDYVAGLLIRNFLL